MRRNGNGQHLNQYTLTTQLRLGRGKGDDDDDDVQVFARPLLSTGGWDETMPEAEGASDAAALQLSDDGGLGAHGAFGGRGTPRVRPNRWHTLTCAVDCVEGVMNTYVDGEPAAEVRAPEICNRQASHPLLSRGI